MSPSRTNPQWRGLAPAPSRTSSGGSSAMVALSEMCRLKLQSIMDRSDSARFGAMKRMKKE